MVSESEAIQNLIIEWGGREDLLAQATTLANVATAKIAAAPRYVCIGSRTAMPLVRPLFRELPRTDQPKVPVGWHPPVDIIIELLSRSTAMQSRRWSERYHKVMPMPKGWANAAQATFPQLTSVVEYSHGWADIVVAAAEWINETETDWKLSDAKEKFGALSLSTHGLAADQSYNIIDAAEWLADFVCCVCGAYGPAKQGDLRLCETHHQDQRWRTGR